MYSESYSNLLYDTIDSCYKLLLYFNTLPGVGCGHISVVYKRTTFGPIGSSHGERAESQSIFHTCCKLRLTDGNLRFGTSCGDHVPQQLS